MNNPIPLIARWSRQPDPEAPICFACADAPAARILPDADADEVRRHLLEGAERVYIGAAALDDGGLVERLVAEFGAERVGVWVDAAPMSVSWRLEIESNADFKTVTPSMPEPCWEIVAGSGERTGARADWWIGEMLARGACAVLVCTDMARDGEQRDRDLNICAGMAERYGDKLWLTPANATECDLSDWVRYGHVGRFVLPEAWENAGLVPADAAAPAEVMHA